MKNLGSLLLICTIFCSLAFTTHDSFKEKTTTVVIDVSHGGSDSGVSFDQTSEKKLF
jgi:N-acetylmuramoyl-L-alanine amidase